MLFHEQSKVHDLSWFEQGSVAWTESVADDGTSIGKVFAVTAVICTIMGALWCVFSQIPKEAPHYKTFKIAVNCGLYGCCAISMHMLNKSLAVTLNAPSLIAVFQMGVAVAIFGVSSGKELLAADRTAVMTWCIVPVCFALMLISSMYTYEYLSLSMLTIMRNMTPLVVLPAEMLVMPPESRPQVNTMIIASLFVMLAGSVIYGGAVSVSMLGIVFVIANMFLAVTDRLLQRRLLVDHCKSIPTAVCSILNNGVAILPTLMVAACTNEITVAMSPEKAAHWANPFALVLLVLSGLCGMGVGYFAMEAQREISATSLLVFQNFTKVGVVVVGIVVFNDPIKSLSANMGLLLNLAGSFVYCHSQMLLQQSAAEKQKLLKEENKASA